MDKTVGDFVTVAKAAYQNDSERGKNRYGETECWLRPVSWRGNKTAYTFYAYDKYSKPYLFLVPSGYDNRPAGPYYFEDITSEWETCTPSEVNEGR